MSTDKIRLINTAISEWFILNPNLSKVAAKELMPFFIKKGIFKSNHRDGLPLRNLLRDLDRKGQLYLIPAVLPERKSTNTNWFFIRLTKSDSLPKIDSIIENVSPDRKPSTQPTKKTSQIKESFRPVVDVDTRVLILGSLPGDLSLQLQQYYAKPTNQFWKIMDALFGSMPTGYNDRINWLLKHKVGLWDVLAHAERIGSLDSAIRNGKPNDIKGLLAKYPSIKTVCFNGTKAKADFDKYIGTISGVNSVLLPSSSGAHAIKFEKKVSMWKDIIEQA